MLNAQPENVTQLAKELVTMLFAMDSIATMVFIALQPYITQLAKTTPPLELLVQLVFHVHLDMFVLRRPLEMEPLANKLELKQLDYHVMEILMLVVMVSFVPPQTQETILV